MKQRVMIVVAGAAAVWCVPLTITGVAAAGVRSAAAGAVTAGVWSRAIEVPGLGALNERGFAGVQSVSCPSAGNCAAGGNYGDGSGHQQAFVVSERHGVWGRAIEVPGLGALNKGGAAVTFSVSCPSAGNCAAGGEYGDGFGNDQAFVVSERHGVWGRAIEVPGLGALNKRGFAAVRSVSCPSAAICAAGGFYADRFGSDQAFVVSERHGVWGRAIEVPGLGALNTGRGAGVSSVSCPAAGNCAAGGFYINPSGGQAFVVSERHGVWGRAIEVPGLAALNVGAGAAVNSVSCASAGTCAAGGTYADRSGNAQAFVVSERHGVWRTAIEVPGSGTLNTGGAAEVSSLSCPSAGTCAAGGEYGDGSGQQAFVVSERHGVWGTAIEVPGLGALNTRGFAELSSVSCPSAGTCAAGGDYRDGSGHEQAFVVSERHGVWGTAMEVPGSGALNKGPFAEVSSVSCPSARYCAAGGTYIDRSHHQQGFVVSRT